ncbi:hypothetical protein CR513_25434, partial [Mucuna pruriens]
MLYGHTELRTGLRWDVSVPNCLWSSKSARNKLHSIWDGPFVITNVFPYGVVELKDENKNSIFQVNGHQIKLFHEGLVPTMRKGLPPIRGIEHQIDFMLSSSLPN